MKVSRSRCGRSAVTLHCLRDLPGCLDDLKGNGPPLRFITVEKPGGCPALDDLRQFPGQIVGVLYPRIHALTRQQTVNMGGIPRQKDPSLPVTGHQTVVYAEKAEPVRIAQTQGGSGSFRNNGL